MSHKTIFNFNCFCDKCAYYPDEGVTLGSVPERCLNCDLLPPTQFKERVNSE